MFSEALKTEIAQVLIYIVLSFVSIVMLSLVNFISNKTKKIKTSISSEKNSELMSMLIEIVDTCVDATNQSIVNDLKSEGNFTKEEAEEAFKTTFDSVKEIILSNQFGFNLYELDELDTLITNLIEKNINFKKLTQPKTYSLECLTSEVEEDDDEDCDCCYCEDCEVDDEDECDGDCENCPSSFIKE